MDMQWMALPCAWNSSLRQKKTLQAEQNKYPFAIQFG